MDINKDQADLDINIATQLAKGITSHDCAAYAVLIFQRGEAGDEWQKAGVEALSKFAEFGWAMFHGLGGLNLNWSDVTKPKPKAKRAAPKPTPKAKKKQ